MAISNKFVDFDISRPITAAWANQVDDLTFSIIDYSAWTTGAALTITDTSIATEAVFIDSYGLSIGSSEQGYSKLHVHESSAISGVGAIFTHGSLAAWNNKALEVGLDNLGNGSVSVFENTQDLKLIGRNNGRITLNAAGTITFAGAVTTIDIDGGTIDGTTIATSNITVGATKTLDVSAGTLTLAADQISGNSVHSGTISDFASTGIDDDAVSTVLTIASSGAVTLAAPTTGNSTLKVNGINNSYTLDIQAGLTAGQSFGLRVRGGASATDAAFSIEDAAAANALLRVSGTGIITSLPTYNNTTASASNVTITSEGVLQRSTSAAKYKKDVKNVTLNVDSILGLLRPVMYKSKCAADDATKYHFGFIADEYVGTSLEPLISIGDDGEVEGFQYERLIPIIVHVLKAMRADVAALKLK